MPSLPSYPTIIFNILGSLAIFLYAMQLLGRNLQNIIGDKIEYVLRKLTGRPAKGMVVGALTTFLTQSSSITVLTLIGLVNVGVLNLRQGVGIILGSEIGTTITAQLVTLEIGLFYFPLIAIGFGLATFSKNEKLVSLGKVVFSFGLLFMGMEWMKKSASPLGQAPLALSLFKCLGKSPFLGVLTGALFTGITSSSSATTSLVVALGVAKLISLPAGFSLILGANIGTCLLELIATVGLSLTAKRVAVAQAVINVLGVIIIFPFISPFANLMERTAGTLSRQIANSHTIFNVTSSLCFLTAVGLIVFIVKKIVPGQPVRIKRGTKYIDPAILGMPHIALVNVRKEIKRTGGIVLEMLGHIKNSLDDNRDDLIEVIYTCEDQIDFLNQEISRYLTLISGHELDRQSSEKVAQLLHGISDIERASDHLNRIAEQLELKVKKKIIFPRKGHQEIVDYLNDCISLFEKSLETFIADKVHQAVQITHDLQKIRLKQARMKIRSSSWSKEKQEIYLQILHHLERLAHHGDTLANIVVSGF